MNQSTTENGYRLKKSEKLFIKLFVMLLRSIAWTSRTELENEGIIDEARRLHGGFILSTSVSYTHLTLPTNDQV